MKQKTVQTAAKRFKKTSGGKAGGKLMRDNAGTSHLFRHKSDRPNQPGQVAAADVKKMRRLIAEG